jgi:hypothetical protein
MPECRLGGMSSQHDPIRIVPLHPGEKLLAPPAAPPRLTYRGGPLLAAVEVFSLFWGPAWQQAESGLATSINAFFDSILVSSLMDQLAEYSTADTAIGRGRRIGSTTIASPPPPSRLPDDRIQAFIQEQVAAGVLPPVTANTLYYVLLPPGVTVSLGSDQSCSSFCGYHDAIDGRVFYAVMPYPDCSGCAGGLDVESALTTTSSHELCEAVTDPVPGQGWYDDSNGEIGDICAWQTKQVDGYTVQLEWSNTSGQCV